MKAKDPVEVQRMFAQIAPRYDFLNHFLSASLDKRWRALAVEKVREHLPARNVPAVCLDLCSGTGDLSIQLHRRLKLPIVASDFCHPMLTRSNAKIAESGFSRSIQTIEADALNLPFPTAAFAAATNAFGLRNLADTRLGLSEMMRVLQPGGVAVILEFSRPVVPVFNHLFNFYSRNILPRLGALISGHSFAYQYLPDSIRKFPPQKELLELMRSVGFKDVGYRNLAGGAVALHWGKRPL
jgi:demethylmenaquinone methyltransferase/2-methoxy-6-polyprenyl-1,4-benzoquinol methylase